MHNGPVRASTFYFLRSSGAAYCNPHVCLLSTCWSQKPHD